MSIFEPQPIEPQVEETINMIKLGCKSLYENITSQHARLFNLIWSNPDFTPQEVITAMGADMAILSELSSDLQTLLKKADPDYKILTPPNA